MKIEFSGSAAEIKKEMAEFLSIGGGSAVDPSATAKNNATTDKPKTPPAKKVTLDNIRPELAKVPVDDRKGILANFQREDGEPAEKLSELKLEDYAAVLAAIQTHLDM
jgi:hypothetical protein